MQPLGGSTFKLFGKHKCVICVLRNFPRFFIAEFIELSLCSTLRKGRHRLYLHHGKEADGSVKSQTPSKLPGQSDELDRLDGLLKHYESGDIQRVAWLDRLTLAEVQKQREVDHESLIQYLPLTLYGLAGNANVRAPVPLY